MRQVEQVGRDELTSEVERGQVEGRDGQRTWGLILVRGGGQGRQMFHVGQDICMTVKALTNQSAGLRRMD